MAAGNASQDGGLVMLTAGDSRDARGGDMILEAGNSDATSGGGVMLLAGNGTLDGGDMTLHAGNSKLAQAGDVWVTAGDYMGGADGVLSYRGGAPFHPQATAESLGLFEQRSDVVVSWPDGPPAPLADASAPKPAATTALVEASSL